MQRDTLQMYPKLIETIEEVRRKPILDERIQLLEPLIEYLRSKADQNQTAYLNFICTHNSRRSQLAQVWAQTAADYFHLPAFCFSGGVEVTAFAKSAVESLRRSGFKITVEGKENPVYSVYHSPKGKPIRIFSKLFDHPVNRAEKFAAIMTCSHADENCPYIPGTEKRISLPYDDPKQFDGTPEEAAKYDERSYQIASEMFYVFTQINEKARYLGGTVHD